ncbi:MULTISPECIES: roadblock/LC7 domain-containing protein [unclassified Luteimonas]
MADAFLRTPRPSDPQNARIRAELDAFASAVPGLRNAVVASVDGFALAEASGKGDNGERLAAMTSSMLALAKAVTRELELGSMEVLMIEADQGKVLMLSIPVPARPLLLMAACSQRSVIGNVLWSARECSQKILSATS